MNDSEFAGVCMYLKCICLFEKEKSRGLQSIGTTLPKKWFCSRSARGQIYSKKCMPRQAPDTEKPGSSAVLSLEQSTKPRLKRRSEGPDIAKTRMKQSYHLQLNPIKVVSGRKIKVQEKLGASVED